ncbi:MAG: DoxX family membrane protein [Pyrinomonadaceae bacterium]|nr:DoxX family membrane protein [Pyrinomonadaceae bacterium]
MPAINRVLKYLLGVFFVLAGLNHFINPDFYLKIMPPYLPWHLFLIYLSGFCEIVLGVMLLIPRYTRVAAWGMIALLVAVFPANIHMAVNSELYPNIHPVALWFRLPLQAVFIAWAYWYTRRGIQQK